MNRSRGQSMLVTLVIGIICVSAVYAIAWRRPQLPRSVPDTVVAESTSAHYGVLGHDGLTAEAVDLGQLAPLMGGDLFVDTLNISLPRVSRQAKLTFHATPPQGEAWYVTFWYKGDINSIGGYDINRTSDAMERLVPEMTVQAEEKFTVWVEPAYEQRATEFVVTLQRVGAPGDIKHEAGLLYGPVTEYHVPLTVTR